MHTNLMKTYFQLNRYVKNETSKLGLTVGQPKVIDYLLNYGESEQKQIAIACEIEPATVGSILLGMEKIGLVKRQNKPGNRRSIYVSLTDKGKDIGSKLETIFSLAEKEVTKNLSEEEFLLLAQLLKKCQERK